MTEKNGNGLRVLIVDDEVEFAATLAMRLELRNFKVNVAHSGREALELLEHERQDLLLLDLNIPDVGGLEVAEALRDNEDAPKIIVVSGDGPAAEAEVKLEPPVVGYMMKPVEFQALLDSVRSLFGG